MVAFFVVHELACSVRCKNSFVMVASKTAPLENAKEATVLRELKETIRKQDKEIEVLKKELFRPTTKDGIRGPSHGHGSSVNSQEEITAYATDPFYRIAANRIGWLGLFLISLSATALIMNGFEHTLERQIELAYFVPLLAGHGGNVGGQAVGTVLSALSANVIALKDAPRIVGKEALSGFAVGCILGVAVGFVAHVIMGIQIHVAAVVLCTLPLVSTIAAALGSTLPFACIAMGLDPKVIAAPAMTSFVDVTGLISYFLIANQIFALFGVEL